MNLLVAGLAVAFGLLTLVSGGSALFGGVEARAAVGNAVPFVLWFNFLAGLAYVVTGAGIFARKRWAAPAAWIIALATAAVFAAFGVHIWAGGAFEWRTVGAMTLRSIFWIIVAWYAGRSMRRVNAG